MCEKKILKKWYRTKEKSQKREIKEEVLETRKKKKESNDLMRVENLGKRKKKKTNKAGTRKWEKLVKVKREKAEPERENKGRCT